MRLMRPDLRLYALLDPERAGGRDLADLARQVAQGGATLIQLRDKVNSTRATINSARAIKLALAEFNIPLLINDRVDVALAARADGVHVGWEDMSVEDARCLLGQDGIIGLSVKTAEQVSRAPLDLLDYVCIGGVYTTSSKNNPEPPIGTAGFAVLAKAVRSRAPSLPVGAIAGIDESNVGAVLAAGADGVAVISALSLAPDPVSATRGLRQLVDGAKRGAA